MDKPFMLCFGLGDNDYSSVLLQAGNIIATIVQNNVVGIVVDEQFIIDLLVFVADITYNMEGEHSAYISKHFRILSDDDIIEKTGYGEYVSVYVSDHYTNVTLI